MARAKSAAKTPKPAAGSSVKRKKSALPFSDRLVLQQWAFYQIGEGFVGLKSRLERASDATTGGESWYAKNLRGIVPVSDGGSRRVSDEAILRYDASIRRHTDAINQRRDPRVRWKYFQWLALFMTELYLDRWFNDPQALLAELNARVKLHNEATGDDVVAYTEDCLRRLALWSATGSGKTLLLHVNLLQYRAGCAQHGRPQPNMVIVVCPREELARQHLEDFAASSIDADYFDPKSVLRRPHAVQVMEVTRLKEEGKKKTVDVGAFGDDNLVFVDEAHQGLRTNESVWREYRDRLSAKGFAFEYSATFGQAVKAAKGDETAQDYARNILLDYAYKRFYEDGYGKDYSILNLKEDPTEDLRQRYLVGCLLSFYQQLKVFEETGSAALAPYGVARPLWVFVGGKVTGSKDDGVDLPEVVEVVLAMQRAVSRPEETCRHLLTLLRGQSNLFDDDKHDVFAGMFPALPPPKGGWDKVSVEALYIDLLRRVFQTDAPGNLHLHMLRGADHELALRVSGGRTFGLVYVGKAREVEKLCKEKGAELGVVTGPAEPGASHFAALNQPESRVHLLVGSRKFTEGWNSWRVSTLGLMNFGQTEGSQVIQLFGRGVRLRGYDMSLKRSRALKREGKLPTTAPDRLPVLETLGVFGLKANYMKQFEEYLKVEGVPERRKPSGSLSDADGGDATADSGGDEGTVRIPITVAIPATPPLYVFTTETLGEERAALPRVLLDLPSDATGTRWIEKHPVTLDWYPQVQSDYSAEASRSREKRERASVHLEPKHIAWLDLDELVRGLLRQRDEHGDAWCSLSVTREGVARLLHDPEKWYVLYLPREFLEFRGWRDVERWRAIAASLLGDYCEKFMARWWDGQEQATMRYAAITPEDRNFDMVAFPGGGRGWQVTVRGDDAESRVWLQYYRDVRDNAGIDRIWRQSQHDWPSAASLAPAQHLYHPVLVLKRDVAPWVSVQPVALDDSEAQFLRDLQMFWERRPAWLHDCSLHVLRNQVRRGVRFFEANNFTPDYLVWLTRATRQCVAVVDPKGLRNLSGLRDPKLTLYSVIKQREADVWSRTFAGVAAPPVDAIRLESFIVANTRKKDINWAEGDPDLYTLDQWFERHVVFQHEDKDRYIERILRAMVASLDGAEGNALGSLT